jgi:hypothetical protein
MPKQFVFCDIVIHNAKYLLVRGANITIFYLSLRDYVPFVNGCLLKDKGAESELTKYRVLYKLKLNY